MTFKNLEAFAQEKQGVQYPKQAIRKLGPSERQSSKDLKPTIQTAAMKLFPKAYPGQNRKGHEPKTSSNAQ